MQDGPVELAEGVLVFLLNPMDLGHDVTSIVFFLTILHENIKDMMKTSSTATYRTFRAVLTARRAESGSPLSL